MLKFKMWSGDEVKEIMQMIPVERLVALRWHMSQGSQTPDEIRERYHYSPEKLETERSALVAIFGPVMARFRKDELKRRFATDPNVLLTLTVLKAALECTTIEEALSVLECNGIDVPANRDIGRVVCTHFYGEKGWARVHEVVAEQQRAQAGIGATPSHDCAAMAESALGLV